MSRNPQARYSFAEHGQQGGRFGGQFITHDTVEPYTLPWGDGWSTLRILPVRQPSDPATPNVINWTPYRLSQDVNHVGDWIRCYYAVRSFGSDAEGRGVSFLLQDHADPTVGPKEETPPFILWSAIKRAIDNGQEKAGWGKLMKGGANRGAALSEPKPVYLCQCLTMHHKHEDYNPPRGFGSDQKPRVAVLSQSGGEALMQLVNHMRLGADPNSADWNTVCEHGDLIGLTPGTGRYVTFYKSTDQDPRQIIASRSYGQQQVLAGWSNASGGGGGGGGGGTGFAKYMAYAEPAYNGIPADLSMHAEYLATRSIQWEQVLNFMSYDQQATLIADKFPADVIMYAFQDHPHWIPERVRQSAVAATTFGGHMQPHGGFTTGAASGTVFTGVPPMAPTTGMWPAVQPVAQTAAEVMQQVVPNAQPMTVPPVQQMMHSMVPPVQQMTHPMVPPVQQLTHPMAQPAMPEVISSPSVAGWATQAPVTNVSAAISGMVAGAPPIAVTQQEYHAQTAPFAQGSIPPQMQMPLQQMQPQQVQPQQPQQPQQQLQPQQMQQPHMSNAATQPAAGFAMPVEQTAQPMSRGAAALAAAKAAAGNQ